MWFRFVLAFDVMDQSHDGPLVHYDVDTVRSCCLACLRHCDASSSTERFKKSEILHFNLPCHGCLTYICETCKHTILLGDKLMTVLPIKHEVCKECFRTGTYKCFKCKRLHCFDLVTRCQECQRVLCAICFVPETAFCSRDCESIGAKLE